MREGLQQDLRDALRRRDRAEAAVLRSLLSALSNAEAVDASTVGGGPGVDGRPTGVGSTDVARRELSDDGVRSVLTAELDERLAAAATFEGIGNAERAVELRAEAELVRRYLG